MGVRIKRARKTKSRITAAQDDKAHYERIGKNRCDLETRICDLERWGRIAFMMAFHDLEHPEGKERLGLMIVQHIEQLTADLRTAFYKGVEDAKT